MDAESNPKGYTFTRDDPILPEWQKGMIAADELQRKIFDPLKYIVPGLLPEGLMILAGRPKIGKSWLQLALCIAVAAGKVALGRESAGPCEPGDVLYLSLEDGERRLQRRLKKLLENSIWPERLMLKTTWRRFDQGGLPDIEEWCNSRKAPRLIAIDTLAMVRAPANGKGQPYEQDYHALSGLHQLSERLRIASIISHHDRKTDAEDVFDTISGTLGLQGAVDTMAVLTKKPQGTTIHIRGRDLEEESSLAMSFDRATCQWSVLGEAADVRRSAERNAVIEALRKTNEAGAKSMSIPEILVATGQNTKERNKLNQLLHKMVADGEVIRGEKKGYYALPSTP
jgi:RecA-family ATPase